MNSVDSIEALYYFSIAACVVCVLNIGAFLPLVGRATPGARSALIGYLIISLLLLGGSAACVYAAARNVEFPDYQMAAALYSIRVALAGSAVVIFGRIWVVGRR